MLQKPQTSDLLWIQADLAASVTMQEKLFYEFKHQVPDILDRYWLVQGWAFLLEKNSWVVCCQLWAGRARTLSFLSSRGPRWLASYFISMHKSQMWLANWSIYIVRISSLQYEMNSFYEIKSTIVSFFANISFTSINWLALTLMQVLNTFLQISNFDSWEKTQESAGKIEF